MPRSAKPWLVRQTSPSEVHTLPLNDDVLHETSVDCVCGPFARPVKDLNGHVRGWIYTHHSLDGREQEPT